MTVLFQTKFDKAELFEIQFLFCGKKQSYFGQSLWSIKHKLFQKVKFISATNLDLDPIIKLYCSYWNLNRLSGICVLFSCKLKSRKLPEYLWLSYQILLHWLFNMNLKWAESLISYMLWKEKNIKTSWGRAVPSSGQA